jgi:predicted nucleic acid-binding protein
MSISVGSRTWWVPDGVFLDANVIIDYLAPGRHHAGATLLLGQLMKGAASGSVSVYVSPLVLDEVWWRLASLRYQRAQSRFPGVLRRWSELGKDGRKRVFRKYGGYLKQKTEQVLRGIGPIGVVPLTEADVPIALAALGQPTGNHEPHDAFHYAVMWRMGIHAIASNDRDFASHPDVVAIPHAV